MLTNILNKVYYDAYKHQTSACSGQCTLLSWTAVSLMPLASVN